MKIKEVLLFILLVCLDFFSKQYFEATMKVNQSIVIIKDFFSLTFVRNQGAAFSSFSGNSFLLIGASIFGFVLFTYLLYKTDKKNKFERICLILMIAGTFGNLIDRATLFYVRDFLDFIIFGYDFAIFNLADTMLCLGVAGLIGYYLLGKDSKNGKN